MLTYANVCRTDNAQLVLQNEALRADNEELVVAIGEPHADVCYMRMRTRMPTYAICVC